MQDDEEDAYECFGISSDFGLDTIGDSVTTEKEDFVDGLCLKDDVSLQTCNPPLLVIYGPMLTCRL